MLAIYCAFSGGGRKRLAETSFSAAQRLTEAI